jgi:hypothetical protein
MMVSLLAVVAIVVRVVGAVAIVGGAEMGSVGLDFGGGFGGG